MFKGLELYTDREVNQKRTWTLGVIVLSILFLTLAGVISEIIPRLSAFRGLMPEDSWERMACRLFLGFGLAALFCIMWIRLFERRGIDSIGFTTAGGRLYCRGLVLGFIFAFSVIALIFIFGGYRVEAGGIFSNFRFESFVPIVVLFFGFAIQGGTEEVLMRGWLFQILTSRYGVAIGIIGNMLVFSLMHAGNISYSTELLIGLFNIVLCAVFLSLYALKEGTIWGVCAWHGIWNWMLGLGFGLEVSGQVIPVQALFIDLKGVDGMPVWLTGGAFGPEASVVTTFVLGCGVLYFFQRPAHGKAYNVPN